MLKSIKKYIFEKQDEKYLEWLFLQNKKIFVNGLIFMLITVTGLSLVDYFYFGNIYYESLPIAERKGFDFDNGFRLFIVPLVNLGAIFLAKSNWNSSMRQFTWIAGIVVFTSALSFFITGMYNDYYTGDDYAYDALVLILFNQILLGLTFRSSFSFNLVLVLFVLGYLSLDGDIAKDDYIYTTSLIILLWVPVLLGMLQLEQSRLLNFKTLFKIQIAHQELEKQSQELKIKNDDLQQFAYASSHDLQEPLRSISNFVKILDKQLDDQLSDQQKTFMGIIVDSTERMKNLIIAILDYSRIGRNKSMETFNCNEVIEDVIMDLNFAIKESKGKIQFSHLPVINGFRSEFSTLIQNLISNALKFRKPGVNPLVTITSISKPQYIQFSVQDNGIGIDQKYANKIFQLFSRLHNASDYKGTGIGLTHSKKIVELHGGKIWIESKKDKGTCFHFTISKQLKIKKDEKEIELHHVN